MDTRPDVGTENMVKFKFQALDDAFGEQHGGEEVHVSSFFVNFPGFAGNAVSTDVVTHGCRSGDARAGGLAIWSPHAVHSGSQRLGKPWKHVNAVSGKTGTLPSVMHRWYLW